MKVYPAIPSLPNFVKLCREDGSVVATTVPIADLTDEDIRDLGKRWTEALLEHAKKKRADAEPSSRRAMGEMLDAKRARR